MGQTEQKARLVLGLFKSVDSTFVPHISSELDAGRLGLFVCDHMSQDTMGLQKWQLGYKYSTQFLSDPWPTWSEGLCHHWRLSNLPVLRGPCLRGSVPPLKTLKPPSSQGPVTTDPSKCRRESVPPLKTLKPPCSQRPLTQLILAIVEEDLRHHWRSEKLPVLRGPWLTWSWQMLMRISATTKDSQTSLF